MATVPQIPPAPASCPTIATGTVTVLGHQVKLWVGAKQTTQKGRILFYWHGTGSNADEATAEMGTQVDEIVAGGGMVASFTDTTMQGTTVNNNVWYTGDLAMADTLLACAVKQLNIDTDQIYTAGCSAGGLMAGSMAFLRSSYIAAAMPNSGGVIGDFALQNSHVPAVITTHGPYAKDMVTVYFETTSLDEDNLIASQGGFAVDCNDGEGHCGAPAAVIAAQWTFCKAHPFGVSPEPYAAGLPSGFPSYCSIIKPEVDAGNPYACRSTKDCGTGKVCCFTAGGMYGSITMGETSACMPTGPASGAYGECPIGKYQLCASNADCTGGLTCNLVSGGLCN